MSSFSDYNNCIKKKVGEELLKNLYIFVSKFFNLLLKKIPHLFYSKLIWRIVIGENYYSNSILDYFKKSDFINTIFSEEKLNKEKIEKTISQNFILKNNIFEKKKIFNLKNLNKFYFQYIQKLIQNEDSLVLLFHTTPHLFIKYFLLELFQNLLKHIPLNNLEENLKKNNLHKFDNIGIQMTQSFQSFVFILFLEILQNIEIENYLKELINFLIFFIEQEFFVKFNFRIFLKIIEFIFLKVFSDKDKNFNSYKQGVRLLRFFIPKCNLNFENLEEDEKNYYEIFIFKIYIIFLDNMEFHQISKFSNITDDLLIYVLNVFRGILLSPAFSPEKKNVDLRKLLIFFVKIVEIKKGKIKEKIFSSLMAYFNQYKNLMILQENLFLDFKIILGFIINYSVKDAIYCLSNLNGENATFFLFLQKKHYLKNEKFLNFVNFINKKLRKKNRNILKFYLQNDFLTITEENLQKKYLKDYKIILNDLIFHIKDKINKVEIYFMMNILKSKIIDLKYKLEIFKKLFFSYTKDVQDFFESLFLHLKNNIYPKEIFENKIFLKNYFLYLFKHIKSKSVSKTILKINFFLLKKCFDNKLICFDGEKCILKNVINDIELEKKILKKNYEKQKKFSYPIHAFINENDNFLEEIKNFIPAKNKKKRFSEDIDIKKFNLQNLNSLIKNNSLENLELDRFVYLRYYLRYLHSEVIEINENKTHGLFFLQILDFYKYIKKTQKNKNDLKTKKEEKKIEDKKIINYYMSKIGQNIILDSFLLKSFFIENEILNIIDNNNIEKLNNFILDPNSQLNTKEKLEFNNNYIKNRNEIKEYLFEIKMLLINFLIKKKKMTQLARNFLKNINNYFEELKKFLMHSCDCIFVKFDEKTNETTKLDFLDINLVSYIGLQDLQKFFFVNSIEKFNKKIILEQIFDMFVTILEFVKEDDGIVVSFGKVEKLEELGRFVVRKGGWRLGNIWKKDSAFVNSYV